MESTALNGLSVLIVEDELLLRKQLAAELERLRADVTQAGTLKSARELAASLDFDLVLLDVNLPDGRSTDLLKERCFPTSTGVIVMTAEGGIHGAVEAMRLGAMDYVAKPFDPAELPLVISRAQRAKKSNRLEEHRRRTESRGADDFVFGPSLAAMQNQLQRILAADERLQTSLPPVLIEGETGTGKTTIARWLHQRGISEKVDVPDPDLHELEKYRILLGYLGLQPALAPPSLRKMRPRGMSRPKQPAGAGPRIILAVGTVNRIKEYPHWAEVVAMLQEKLKPEWVLIGGAGETIPAALQTVLPRETTRDLVGKTTLETLAEEIEEADLFLGVDTGPAHLALALEKPAVVVLGGGDYGRFFPYGKARVVTQRMDCFQCHWECKYERALCLHDIPPTAVVREVQEVLGDNRRDPD